MSLKLRLEYYFSDVTPVIEQKNDTDKATWTLIGYKSVANADAAKRQHY